jgi:hypothetical protein
MLAVAIGVGFATAGAAFATNAAFNTGTDSAPASAVAGLSTVPEATDASGPSVGAMSDGRERRFEVNDAGTVVLRVTRQDLEVVRVRVRQGWIAGEPETSRINGTPKIEVEFVRGSEHLEFVALLIDGEVVPRINRENERHTATEPDDDSVTTDSSGTTTDDHEDDNESRDEGRSDDDRSTSGDDASDDPEHGDIELDEDGPEPPEPPEPAETIDTIEH